MLLIYSIVSKNLVGTFPNNWYQESRLKSEEIMMIGDEMKVRIGKFDNIEFEY